MVDESTIEIYDDDALDDYIETYPLMDELGTTPLETDITTTPPTMSERDEWIPTYDLHAAASDIWEEKAAALAETYDFKADGGSYSRSQQYLQYIGKARYHQSRRSAKTIKMYVEPRVISSEE